MEIPRQTTAKVLKSKCCDNSCLKPVQVFENQIEWHAVFWLGEGGGGEANMATLFFILCRRVIWVRGGPTRVELLQSSHDSTKVQTSCTVGVWGLVFVVVVVVVGWFFGCCLVGWLVGWGGGGVQPGICLITRYAEWYKLLICWSLDRVLSE